MSRIRKAVKPVILVLAVAAVSILSCSSESAVTGSGHGASIYDVAISGKCIGPSHEPLNGAKVRWYCTGHPSWVLLGMDETNASGEYEIYHTWGTAHDSHDLVGIASYSVYDDVYNYIYDFDSSEIPYPDMDFTFVSTK
jgi:hypothetical protein